MIRPIPENHGCGFFSGEQRPEHSGYREVNFGRFWNYHFTPECYEWPKQKLLPVVNTIDGFSPNLNKTLHVGHLRNLALACSLSRLAARPVALLGASQGVLSTSLAKFKEWCDFLNYKPEIYYDVLQPWDYVPHRPATDADNEHFPEDKPPTGCMVWDGPHRPVIVLRSDGRPTYAFYEIAFEKYVSPTYYLTGAEQKEHFESLGLGDKHLGMGLVLGKDGKKMKSRTGDSPPAEEILEAIKGRLKETPESDKVAWNILAWNFLHTGRAQNVKFDLEGWTDPDAPGMYITYTYARVKSALKGQSAHMIRPQWAKALHYEYPKMDVLEWSKGKPDAKFDLTESDVSLLGCVAYQEYYYQRSVELMDPTQLANYAHTLARKLGLAYHQEKINGGRYGFRFAVTEAASMLKTTMNQIAMFPLEKV